jgi:hypothetical protein
MRFTCDRCHGDYEATQGSAIAHVYIKDRRCNHVEARCSHCGTTEVIFLGPHRIEEAIRVAEVDPVIHVEADGALRVRAERAWQAVEQPQPETGGEQPPRQRPVRPAGPAGASASGRGTSTPATPPQTIRPQRLNKRQEREVARFAETLEHIPDDLLWDGFEEQEPSPEQRTD